MDPQAALLEYKQKADAELERFFQQKIAEYGKISDFARQFTADLAEFTMRGGKRFRAALVYYGYKLLNGTAENEIIKLSIFIELIQSYLLIHDDIMDRSSLRRGGPTIHKIFEQYSHDQGFQDDVHFGNTMAILLGDLSNQFALEIISASQFPSDDKSELLRLVAQEVSQVYYGQLHDVLLGYNHPPGYTETDVLAVYRYKTATYTYKLPLFAGAVLAGATQEELNALNGFAIPGGVAYQIRDDILGVFEKSKITGKEPKDDLCEGKKTLLATTAYANASFSQKEQLDRYLGKRDLTDSEAEIVRAIFRDTGSLEYTKHKCQEQIEEAKQSLAFFKNHNSNAYNFLKETADLTPIKEV